MRKISVFAGAVLMLVMTVLSVGAQEGNIIETAVANDDFSSLVAAVQAADPAIAETLQGEGPFTVFAPTNQAFANLASTLGVELEDILADQELVTTVLLYHVVAGEVPASTVVTLDGEFVETLLADNFIGVSVEDGNVVLNDIVNVVATDVNASNGIIHVIDNVLLPQSVLDSLEAPAEQGPAIPMAPQFTNIRVAHLSPDTPAVDVYVDSEAAITGLEFGSFSAFVTLPAGTYEVAVAPAGTSIEDAAIGPAEFALPAGEFVTVSAVGSLEAGTLQPVVAIEDMTPLGEDEVAVTVFHAIEDAPPVDVLVDGATVLVEYLAFPGTFTTAAGALNDGAFTLTVPAGIYDLSVVPNGATEPVVLDLSDTELVGGNYYSVAATGSLESPSVAVDVTGPETLSELFAAVAPMPIEEEEAEEITATGTIVEIAAGAEDFSTLVAAVQAADPAILEALSGEGPLTVFAPTNQAFSNLLSTLGLTADELLASTDILNEVLLYHVVSGDVRAETVLTLDGQLVATLLDDAFIGISVSEGGVVLNDIVNVIQTDIVATNGVIHVIDNVLLPQSVMNALGM